MAKVNPKNTLAIIIGATAAIAILFLVIYGSLLDKEVLYTTGFGLLNFAVGVVLAYYFKSGENEELKKSLDEWREWYKNECEMDDVE